MNNLTPATPVVTRPEPPEWAVVVGLDPTTGHQATFQRIDGDHPYGAWHRAGDTGPYTWLVLQRLFGSLTVVHVGENR